MEGEVWAEAKLTVPERKIIVPQTLDWHSLGHSKVCFIDGAWKENDKFSGSGWFCRTVGS